jgi:hypothetical protein
MGMLNRDALKYNLVELFHDQERGAISFDDYIDRVLALIRPVEGVVLPADEAAELIAAGDPEARMNAYYYGFERTGFAVIDDVLSAVATAGKHYHGTDQWASPDFGTEGEPTEEEAIQAAANRGAAVLRALAERLEADQ